MTPQVLQRLQSEDFAVAVGFHSNPAVLRRRLARMPEVPAVREALQQGAITEETIRRFVSHLMEDFVRGEHFAHEDALAAVAVALETRPTNFADKFLRDLAQLKLAEMSLCIRVARECLKYRASVARCRARIFPPWDTKSDVSFRQGLLPWGCSSKSDRLTTTIRVYEEV